MNDTPNPRQNTSASQTPCTFRSTDRLLTEFSERMDEVHRLLQDLHYADNPIHYHEILREMEKAILRAKAAAEG